MRNRAIILATSLVTVREAQLMAIAGADQVRNTIRPLWGKRPEDAPEIRFFAEDNAPDDFSRIVLCERGRTAEETILGYHQRGYVPVFVDLILEKGGEVLAGQYSVSHILTHELVEDDGNEDCDQWRVGPDGAEWAQELCDAVEGGWYPHHATGCALTNFLQPEYFNAKSTAGYYDYLGTLRAPFTIARDGYAIRRVNGPRVNTFGAEMPTWRVEEKKASRRAARMAPAPDAAVEAVSTPEATPPPRRRR